MNNISGNAEAFKKGTVVEQPPYDPSTGFDYRVHVKDAKTGRLIRLQHYARHAHGGEVLLERPIGSGNCFYENGVPAGRYRFQDAKGKPCKEKISEDHIEVAAAPASYQEALEQDNEALRAELEALKAEKQGQKRKD
jgi:hypothetical protein